MRSTAGLRDTPSPRPPPPPVSTPIALLKHLVERKKDELKYFVEVKAKEAEITVFVFLRLYPPGEQRERRGKMGRGGSRGRAE